MKKAEDVVNTSYNQSEMFMSVSNLGGFYS